jgi:DNA-binding transcriptional MerR regulator
MEQLSIGEFSRRSGLSAKALRLYDEMGLLPPARVDPATGYRSYAIDQLERARLVASLRAVGVPLATIGDLLAADRPAAAARLVAYWEAVETDHAARRALARSLVDELFGRRSTVYEVVTREMPARTVLCLERRATSDDEVRALGKDFIGMVRGREVPQLEGIAGASFLIYHGQVSAESDGPVEWCRPVPDDRAHDLAAEFPQLTLRTEEAHEEAYVDLGPGGSVVEAEWQLISGALWGWAAETRRTPSALGVRLTFLFPPPGTPQTDPPTGPLCTFALPLAAA